MADEVKEEGMQIVSIRAEIRILFIRGRVDVINSF